MPVLYVMPCNLSRFFVNDSTQIDYIPKAQLNDSLKSKEEGKDKGGSQEEEEENNIAKSNLQQAKEMINDTTHTISEQ